MDRTTVNVYETHVDDWIEHRRRARPASIDAFAARVPPGVRADVGCGPGWHSADLGTPVVAFDAARGMAAQVRTFAPDAWPLVELNPKQRVWTDDYTNVVGAILRHMRD